MAFCANCGAQLDGRFCGKCGAAADAFTTGSQPPRTDPRPNPASGNALPDNAASALAYVLGAITGILFLALEPYSRNREVRFHAWQSILFTVASFVIYIAEMIVAFILPGFLSILVYLIMMVVSFGFLGLWLYLLWKTYNGEKVVLPVIGPIAQRNAG